MGFICVGTATRARAGQPRCLELQSSHELLLGRNVPAQGFLGTLSPWPGEFIPQKWSQGHAGIQPSSVLDHLSDTCRKLMDSVPLTEVRATGTAALGTQGSATGHGDNPG